MPTGRQAVWFVGLWAAGVVVLGIAAGLLHGAIGLAGLD